jgi:alpha-beta hydrolase superfamily lysophospholipase
LFAGVAFICPGIYSPFMPGLVKRLALAAPAPTRLQQRRLRVPLRKPELFTDAPCWQAFIVRDPLALRTITWRFAQEDRKLTRYAREAPTFLHLPTLLMLAGQDRIVDNRRTREYFGRFPGHRKTLIEYYGAAHTLEFESDPTQYFSDLADWIRQTANSQS